MSSPTRSTGDDHPDHRRTDHVPNASQQPALFRANPFLDENEAMEVQEPSGVEDPLPNADVYESLIDSLLLVLDDPPGSSTEVAPGETSFSVCKGKDGLFSISPLEFDVGHERENRRRRQDCKFEEAHTITIQVIGRLERPNPCKLIGRRKK